jgi:Fe-S-cluster-containing hydrogenase component 2
MYVVTIDASQCEGCGECAAACPSQIIAMVESVARVTGDTSECVGCESCVVICAPGGVSVVEY